MKPAGVADKRRTKSHNLREAALIPRRLIHIYSYVVAHIRKPPPPRHPPAASWSSTYLSGGALSRPSRLLPATSLLKRHAKFFLLVTCLFYLNLLLSSVGREKRNWRPAFGCLPPISKIFTLCAGCARAAQDESFRVLKEGIYPARQVCHNYILNSLTSYLFYHQLSRREFRFIVALSVYIYSATHRERHSFQQVCALYIYYLLAIGCSHSLLLETIFTSRFWLRNEL